jgi:DNA processing protein
MNDAPELRYYLAFSLIRGVGRVTLGKIKDHFGSLEEAWSAGALSFKEAGVEDGVIEEIVKSRSLISPEAEIEKLARNAVQAFTPFDEGYPKLLREIHDYPPVIYVKGKLVPDELCLAVVGSRQPTVYGRQVAEEITTELARSGITIVSGLARGIDSIAHRTALEAGGRSIGVLGSGVDIIYPPENKLLAQEIVKNGALVSEMPLGTSPKPEYFPRRNRIMSGLATGVLVIEAKEKSGALITASLALEQNREVFAVPGSIFSPNSKGTNRLIQEGAKLVSKASDIFEELNLVTTQPEILVEVPADPSEASIFERLSREPMHVDEICRLSQLPISTVTSTLAMMELKGLVKQVSPMNYVRAGNYRNQ